MFDKGDKVKIALPKTEKTITTALHLFDGKVTTITDAIHTKGSAELQYTLKGCEVHEGKPFFFLKDWLIAIEESGAET